MRRVRVRAVASREIDEAFTWYLRRSPRAAARFLAAVDKAVAQIRDAPEQFPLVRGQLRRVLLRRFPYAVYYKVFPSVVWSASYMAIVTRTAGFVASER